MRVVNGNTACKKLVSLCFINADGVLDKDRKRALQSTGADVEAISETHLTQAHQGCLEHSFGHYEGFWGAPVFGKAGGVGFLVFVFRGSCWHARLLAFVILLGVGMLTLGAFQRFLCIWVMATDKRWCTTDMATVGPGGA